MREEVELVVLNVVGCDPTVPHQLRCRKIPLIPENLDEFKDIIEKEYQILPHLLCCYYLDGKFNWEKYM